jgi:hypothetical protein
MARSEIRIGSRNNVACMAELPQPSPPPPSGLDRHNPCSSLLPSGQCLPGQTLTTPTGQTLTTPIVVLDRRNPCSPLLTPLRKRDR